MRAQVDAALWRVECSSLAAYSTGSSPCSCKGIHILIHVHVHTSPVNLEETTQTATPDETGQTQAGIGRRTPGSDMRRPQQIHFTHMPSLRSQSCRAKTTQSTRHFLHLHLHQQYPNRNLTTQTPWKTPSDNSQGFLLCYARFLVQMCLRPRGARGIKPGSFKRGISCYISSIDHQTGFAESSRH